jgi:hypothetical protein
MMLTDIQNWFTEGFETADRKGAKVLVLTENSNPNVKVMESAQDWERDDVAEPPRHAMLRCVLAEG